MRIIVSDYDNFEAVLSDDEIDKITRNIESSTYSNSIIGLERLDFDGFSISRIRSTDGYNYYIQETGTNEEIIKLQGNTLQISKLRCLFELKWDLLTEQSRKDKEYKFEQLIGELE